MISSQDVDMDPIESSEAVNKRDPRTRSDIPWRDRLRQMSFDDFIPAFEEYDWDVPSLWEGITIQDFKDMGIQQRGRIAKFRAMLQSKKFKQLCDDDNSHRKLSIFTQEEHGGEDESFLMRAFEFLAAPCNFLFEHTCIDCEIGTPGES